MSCWSLYGWVGGWVGGCDVPWGAGQKGGLGTWVILAALRRLLGLMPVPGVPILQPVGEFLGKAVAVGGWVRRRRLEWGIGWVGGWVGGMH